MNAPASAPATRTVAGVCAHDCPDSCGWLVTVEDRAEGPVPVALRGNPSHPYSRGELCPKVNRYVERAMSPDRVLTPLRRVDAKGTGTFEPISWDDALAEIAQRWHAVIAEHGPSAIVPLLSAGNQSELATGFGLRLFGALGTSILEGSVCGLTAGAGTALTYGSGAADDPMEIRFAKTILLWGTNTRLTNRHLWPFIEEARANGATVTVIDTLRTITAEQADVFIQPLPGTDVAMMLAVMHVLVRDGLVDRSYLDAHASGFDELEAHVRSWTPARAAAICGVSAEEIESLAHRYADGPSFIRTVIGPEHAEHGATFFRTLSMLPVLTGAWKHRGGGFARSVGTVTGAALRPLTRPEHVPNGFARTLQVNHFGRWLTDASEESVRALLIWNANPAVTLPNAALIREGLSRDDLFTVVHEQFITDTARYADIVLPATTQLESDDVTVSWGSPHINYNNAAMAPRGEAVSNSELFRRLATALGLTDPALHASDDELLRELIPEGSPFSLDDLRADGIVRVDLPPQVYRDGGFPTADGRAVLASQRLGAAGLGTVPDWVPSGEGVGADAELVARRPFLLATPKTHMRFLNTSYSELPGHADRERGPFVEICAADAATLGVADGAMVAVENDRASLELPVKISARVRPGLVAIPYGWTSTGHGAPQSANSLTNDTIVNHGGSVAYNDTRVSVWLLGTPG